ncbi:hypothetical protein BofuT4_P033900.1 [Botrytis cinerea T4]|uniref:Uncharacterized protein n=1 Tax=Botryotinia fuckeliana (strain T4) TaxID=999810 RepID=G2Y820_BOTF4|nr:hypothetical protein BofuT4_P033900.1 [Botrytis cinerea T4]
MSLAQWVDAFPFLTMPHKTPAAKQASRDRSRKVVLTYDWQTSTSHVLPKYLPIPIHCNSHSSISRCPKASSFVIAFNCTVAIRKSDARQQAPPEIKTARGNFPLVSNQEITSCIAGPRVKDKKPFDGWKHLFNTVSEM